MSLTSCRHSSFANHGRHFTLKPFTQLWLQNHQSSATSPSACCTQGHGCTSLLTVFLSQAIGLLSLHSFVRTGSSVNLPRITLPRTSSQKRAPMPSPLQTQESKTRWFVCLAGTFAGKLFLKTNTTSLACALRTNVHAKPSWSKPQPAAP